MSVEESAISVKPVNAIKSSKLTKEVIFSPDKLYCEGPDCSFAWDQESIPPGDRHKVDENYYCTKCFSKWKGKKNIIRFADNHPAMRSLSRKERISNYQEFIHICETYFKSACVIVLFFPLVAIAQPTRLRNYIFSRHLNELWLCISKLRAFACFAVIYLHYVCIACLFPFTSQAVFWGLLEIYSVLFHIVNLLYRTPIKNYIGPKNLGLITSSRTSAQETPLRLALMFWIPCFGLANILHLILHVPFTSMLAHGYRHSEGEELNKLNMVHETTKMPLDSRLLPGAFMSEPPLKYAIKRLGPFIKVLQVVMYIFIASNVILMYSWVTNADPNTDFLLPGTHALINSPNNVAYSVEAVMEPKLCQSTSNTTTALWNVQIDPAPSPKNGIPLLTIAFYNNSTVVPFSIVNCWNVEIVSQDTISVSIRPFPFQAQFSFLGNFYNISSCPKLSSEAIIASTTTYPMLSVQEYVEQATSDFYQQFIAAALLIKNIVQFFVMALNVSHLSIRIWVLWIKFDAITDMGLFHPKSNERSYRVDLAIASNLGVWVQLRKSVIAATKLYATFIQVLISLSLVQLSISFGGLLLYCLTGNAPMPTYFLLMLGLASSLMNLMFLLPLAAALSIQSKQGDMLRKVLNRYHLQKSRGLHDPQECHVESYLTTMINTIDNHDDRIRFWGVEMSPRALRSLSVTLASGISFILSKGVQYSWSSKNPIFVGNK